MFAPDLVIAPFLKRPIPADVWRKTLCLIVHPGIRGDKGPSALDWAILSDEPVWGVTLVEAREDMDAGPVWAWREFKMRQARKSSLYRHEVTEAAVACVFEAIERLQRGRRAGMPANWGKGRQRPACRKADRTIDPAMQTAGEALRIIQASDGDPGALVTIAGQPFLAFDATVAEGLSGPPGALIGRAGGRVCLAFATGALWIGHLRRPEKGALKLPAARLLERETADLPALEAPANCLLRIEGGVGFLDFHFYNGAMSADDCDEMRKAVVAAKTSGLSVLVLQSDADCWSNGIHLGVIESAASPADESWCNINAMNALVLEIIDSPDCIVIAGLIGNAGAGGVFLSLAADEVWMRGGVILNPHYKDMGNLYGSEYWTYLLPARVGEDRARHVTQARLPMGIDEAMTLGLVTRRLAADAAAARAEICESTLALAASPVLAERLAEKRARRDRDEAAKPLEAYRAEELQRMRRNFYGFDPSYHVARYNFIRKTPKSRTPVTLAVHRANKEGVDRGRNMR
ncbi:enoyl-CoA hydratase-related protein [Rhizobium leguminosarum]|nr:enoyl-CoA hydratase-related protein [Rhizobium leguminosarum]MBP2444100.1 putative two-component system hydrogenase maturation factor HypX/HoxX [Rhizobium leguminosarum]